MIHQFNIIVHVLAGTLALVVGVAALLAPKFSSSHKRFGRIFLYLLAVVVGTGFLGWYFFRSNDFLLMLTLLSGYVGYAGWRTIRLKEAKTSRLDALAAALALTLGLLFLRSLQQDPNWNPAVVYATLGALVLVTVYDLVKHVWLHPQLKSWWLYEHIYKMISAFSAIFSAFTGTVLPHLKPYSQIVPSSLCVGLIVVMIWVWAGKRNRKIRKEHLFVKQNSNAE